MEPDRFYYADEEHSVDDEYWFNNQKNLAQLVFLQIELLNTIHSLDQNHEDKRDMEEMLIMVNGAYRSLYKGFRRQGMQYDADLVIHDVLAQSEIEYEIDEDNDPDS